MSPNKEQDLYRRFPELFIQKDLPMSQTCMCWGIDCGDGWYDLLDQLCRGLRFLNKKLEGEAAVTFVQIKEKFGTLRVYLSYDNDQTDWLVREAENNSAKTCELCGQPGKIRGKSWVTTRCDTCNAIDNFGSRDETP